MGNRKKGTTGKKYTKNRMIQKKTRSKYGSHSCIIRIPCVRKTKENHNRAIKPLCSHNRIKGSWRLLPKDSCEVYKDQLNRRKAARVKRNTKRQMSETASEASVSTDDSRRSSTSEMSQRRIKFTKNREKYPKSSSATTSTMSSYTSRSYTTSETASTENMDDDDY